MQPGCVTAAASPHRLCLPILPHRQTDRRTDGHGWAGRHTQERTPVLSVVTLHRSCLWVRPCCAHGRAFLPRASDGPPALLAKPPLALHCIPRRNRRGRAGGYESRAEKPAQVPERPPSHAHSAHACTRKSTPIRRCASARRLWWVTSRAVCKPTSGGVSSCRARTCHSNRLDGPTLGRKSGLHDHLRSAHPRRDSPHTSAAARGPALVCDGTRICARTCPPRLPTHLRQDSPTHLRRDSPTPAPGLGSPLPHLHRDWPHPWLPQLQPALGLASIRPAAWSRRMRARASQDVRRMRAVMNRARPRARNMQRTAHSAQPAPRVNTGVLAATGSLR